MDRDGSMNRRDLLRLAGLASLAGLTGCGVASRGGVIVDGPGPSAGTGGGPRKSPPLSPENQTAPKDLVLNFLQQAAGDPADTKGALGRWKSYMTPEFAADRRWDNETRITVVWVKYDRVEEVQGALGRDTDVFFTLVPLGRLDKHGWLTPAAESGPREVKFTVAKQLTDNNIRDAEAKSGQHLLIKNVTNAPEGLLLSTTALSSYFEYRNLYFWDRSSRFLIPDGRYVPSEWEWQEATREKKLVEWLLAGPSPRLEGAVQLLPDGISMPDLPGKLGPNRLVLNFTGLSGETNLNRLASQLTWTLLPECRALTSDTDKSPIIIRVDSVEKMAAGAAYLKDNPTAVKVALPGSQQAFAVDEHRLRRVRNAGEISPSPVPLLTDDQNRDVEWAAYGTDRRTGEVNRIALVTRDARGKTALLIAAGKGAKLTAVAALGGKQLSHPVFVDDDSLFLIADGRLHHVRLATRDVAMKMRVSAFSVAVDGRRMAYIDRGRLYTATLSKSDNAFTISAGRVVPTILASLNGVAFTGESWLAVSGTYEDQTRVVEVTLDGGMVGNPLHPTSDSGWLEGDVLTSAVTSLTASLDDPTDTGPDRRIFLTANDLARDATSRFVSVAGDVLGEPAGRSPVNAFFLS